MNLRLIFVKGIDDTAPDDRAAIIEASLPLLQTLNRPDTGKALGPNPGARDDRRGIEGV